MLLLNCSSKLHQLEVTLRRRLPETLQVYGAVRTINRGNPVAQEVLVDSWPDFKAILTGPRKEVALDSSDFYTSMYAGYYRDLGAYRELLSRAVNWDHAFCIHGLRDGLYEASRDIAKDKGVKLEVFRYFAYFHPDPSSIPEIRLDPNMRLSTLDVSHLDVMNENWPYGGNKYSRRFMDSLIRHFPNFCLLDSAGQLVSWSISDTYGAMGRSVTVPQHRGRGYNGVLNNVLAKRLHALGYPSYGHVAVDNYTMQRLQERQGFHRQPNLCHFILHNAALYRTPTLTPKPGPATTPA
ncbi:glycine N-acyltransferase-like protein 3 isoform X2 [Pelodiscus sinensis]|uniref:glycine N-acyltransferase-like protein 3 isoform X2 n=1 Tax=Pelodiscus sinensis TaxID=13735 RepID=UPI0003C4BB22|nr:glycine N-acyltransferase-like protein 3 isoform X2 [Pelodiscus sinensis]|eukprot:XP_006113022.1 glycine N-acyltransferase-like protein 3 isoform X2 [Pelodiscus sinensis]